MRLPRSVSATFGWAMLVAAKAPRQTRVLDERKEERGWTATSGASWASWGLGCFPCLSGLGASQDASEGKGKHKLKERVKGNAPLDKTTEDKSRGNEGEKMKQTLLEPRMRCKGRVPARFSCGEQFR